MTIIEKMYSGEDLTKEELRYIATGYSRHCTTEPGNYEEIDRIEGELDRWTRAVDTIIRVGDDFWSIPWEEGLTEYQENEFFYQPYKVARKERIITEVYYEEL